jgi:hypothetical protein
LRGPGCGFTADTGEIYPIGPEVEQGLLSGLEKETHGAVFIGGPFPDPGEIFLIRGNMMLFAGGNLEAVPFMEFDMAISKREDAAAGVQVGGSMVPL